MNVLIVGASSGIGKEIWNQCTEKGFSVFTMGRQSLDSEGHIIFDALQPSFEIPDSWPQQFHALIYCPGTIQLKPITRLTSTDFIADFQVNVLGFVAVVQGFLPRLKKAEGAAIVTFSTVATQVGIGFHSSIAASKGGLQSLCLSLAAELAPSQIRVNVIAPSLTDTPLASQLLNSPEKREASAKRHPLNQIGNPSHLASLAITFIQPESAWVTGQVLTVDGGLSKIR